MLRSPELPCLPPNSYDDCLVHRTRHRERKSIEAKYSSEASVLVASINISWDGAAPNVTTPEGIIDDSRTAETSVTSYCKIFRWKKRISAQGPRLPLYLWADSLPFDVSSTPVQAYNEGGANMPLDSSDIPCSTRVQPRYNSS